MTDVSFAHVPAEGFTAFSAHLEHDVWGSIDVSTYVGADGRPTKPLGDAPAIVLFKVQLRLVVADVIAVVHSTGGAKTCDDAWDNAQRRLTGLIGIARMSSNPLEKNAANRLHALLLLGKHGGEQTRLSYQQEVDFGRKQIRLAAEPSCVADIAQLGLATVMADIGTATEDLASAIGHGPTDLAPAKQRKAAVAECIRVFGTVHRALAWVATNGATGADRERAVGLSASLEDLAGKYPIRATKPKTAAVAAPQIQ